MLLMARLHIRWTNPRYEQSRWMLAAAMLGFAVQYVLQMLYGFRATNDSLGAEINILIYTPCFSLMSLAIYNVETTKKQVLKMFRVCVFFYTLIVGVWTMLDYWYNGLSIGNTLYILFVLFVMLIAYCIYNIVKQMLHREMVLEEMTAIDMFSYVRYSRASMFIFFLTVVAMLFAILSTSLLYIVGSIALLALLFFNLTFVALGNYYIPSEELLFAEEEAEKIQKPIIKPMQTESNQTSLTVSKAKLEAEAQSSILSAEREQFIQQRLEQWCKSGGYKDNSVNMLILSGEIKVNKEELRSFFAQTQNTTFRIWLSDIRFRAAQRMILEYPDYSNDIISMECGFSSRTHLYRIFKERVGCTPKEWREKQV